MKSIEKYLIPLGMLGATIYICHTILGRFLWAEYNPITTDISSLTAIGAPNKELLTIFTTIYGVLVILFAAGMMIKSFRENGKIIGTGWSIFFIMQLVSFLGYMLFPLTNDKTEMTFNNMMHIIVTMIVVFTTIAASFILAVGYLKQTDMKNFGVFTLGISIIITVFGMLNPIGMASGWNILGLTERIVIYSLQVLTFVFSAYYTFFNKRAISNR